MLEEQSFLGRGWSFPPTFQNGRVELVSGKEDIEQSLEILLSTSLGERVMLPEYGCNLADFQFEPISSNLLAFVKTIVENAILYFEPRIRLESVEVSESDTLEAIEGRLEIKVDYVIRETNSRFNFVFPFYLNEGIAEGI